jgi:alkylation response protein AidB-like acyl-CoA dehydrogenase
MRLDRFELRRQDYSLSQDQSDLQAAYAKFFRTNCPIERVRDAEPVGFDKSLWEKLCATGATTMAFPASVGGDGAELVDLTLIAEEIGRSLAPVPWIDHVCAGRLLARFGALTGDDHAADIVGGRQIAALEPQNNAMAKAKTRLLPSGSIADHVIIRDQDQVVRLKFDSHPPKIDNLGRLPMGWIDVQSASTRTVLASGPQAVAEYRRAVDEWMVLTAAALVGMTDEAMRIAAEFAKTRYTMGVPIATLQAISHPLANMSIAVQGGRNLARRAAWFSAHEPAERPELPLSAFVFVAEEAARATAMAVHIQGGLGVSAEAASTAYFVRAKGWSAAAGDPAVCAQQITEIIAGRMRGRMPGRMD